jgi:hypothetical protein
MQGTFQRVRMNVLEMPAREMEVSTHLVSCGCPTMLGLSNTFFPRMCVLQRMRVCSQYRMMLLFKRWWNSVYMTTQT